MNLRYVGYRAYQCVFGLGARLLPWRQPETITGPGSLADIPARLHLHPGGGSAADGGVGGQGGQSHLPRAGDL